MKLKKLIGGRENLHIIISLLRFVPDKLYLKILYRLKMKKKLDLKNPKTFNEKLQWIKLYDRLPIYTVMADKYESKEYVSSIIGDEHIIPTLGVWDRFEDIDFDSLPNQFVLKCTHDSGGLVICKDKSKLDIEAARRKINKSLKFNFYWVCREWSYKNIKPRIIAEKFIENDKDEELIDYKFYCFDGVPKFLYVSQGLNNHETASISFLTLDWTFAPYERNDFKPFTRLPKMPQQLDKMIALSKELSKGCSFLRVDLYEVGDQIFFSELTHTPSGGFLPFKNLESDLEIGDMITLKSIPV